MKNMLDVVIITCHCRYNLQRYGCALLHKLLRPTPQAILSKSSMGGSLWWHDFASLDKLFYYSSRWEAAYGGIIMPYSANYFNKVFDERQLMEARLCLTPQTIISNPWREAVYGSMVAPILCKLFYHNPLWKAACRRHDYVPSFSLQKAPLLRKLFYHNPRWKAVCRRHDCVPSST